MQMVTDPEKRIKNICNSIFPLIYTDYCCGRWSAEEARNKLEEYKARGMQLAEEVKDNANIVICLEKSYKRHVALLNGTYTPEFYRAYV